MTFQEFLKTDFCISLIYFLFGYISICIIKKIFNNLQKRNDQIYVKFFKNVLQGFIVLFVIFQVGNRFDSIKDFTATILTSSSLLVVVLGFAFQESLADFIAGFLISIFKPFNTNDRVHLVNSNISGTIETITIRHTIIRTFNNSRVIIPNSVMNKEIIENSHMIDPLSGNFLDIEIDFDSDIDKAKEIIETEIKNHPLVVDTRTVDQKLAGIPQISVIIRDFSQNGICLRTTIWTENIDNNFKTCSELRYSIFKKFKENKIKIPYQYQTVEISNESLENIKKALKGDSNGNKNTSSNKR